MLRAFRLLRVLKLAKAIKSLRILLSTIMEVAKNVSYMSLLLLLYVFMFAVLGMQRKSCGAMAATPRGSFFLRAWRLIAATVYGCMTHQYFLVSTPSTSG